MGIIEAILIRRSIRGFRPNPVPKKVLEELFETCRWAPSSENTQPWEIAVLGGKVMEELKARLGERARLDPMGKTFHPDIPLNELYGSYLERRLAVRDSILVDGGLLLSH